MEIHRINKKQAEKVAVMVGKQADEVFPCFIHLPGPGESGPVKVIGVAGRKLGNITLKQAFKL